MSVSPTFKKIAPRWNWTPDQGDVGSFAVASAGDSPAFAPVDGLYTGQWHFGMIGRIGYQAVSDTRGIERVWDEFTGAGVAVGIWDSGVQSSHWDLSANYDASRQVTVEGTLNDGQPVDATQRHGTAVAGLIAAADNGQGGVGVAFDASITSVRIFGGADDINAYHDRYLLTLDSLGNFDVTNHSYGRSADFSTAEFLAMRVEKFETAAEQGRNGLGTINVKSAGNVNLDGNGEWLSASRFTVSVAATDNNATGNAASYSTYGAHILVAAPAGSVTTDMLGSGAGYNGLLGGDYTNLFNGTSASSPITVGVVTLMLDANAGLGWRDVQNILAYSATGTGSLYSGVTTNENSVWKWNGAADWNGGSLHYSEDYGYGMVNAYAAVRMAEVWSLFHPTAATSANEMAASTGTLVIDEAVDDVTPVSYSFNVAQDVSLEHVSLTVSLTHTWFTDLRMRLVAPDGTTMTLYDGTSGSSSTADETLTYTFGVDGFRGVSSAGEWTLEVEDTYLEDDGTVHSVSFTGYGSTPDTNDVYHYTDEVLTVLAQPGQAGRQNLWDTNGGTDWIDAAAMFGDVVLNLNTLATSTLDGSAFLTMAGRTQIENGITGDGDDTIIGNTLANKLYGMRGDDSIDAGAGDDWLDGGTGVDTLSGGTGNDTYVVDDANDQVIEGAAAGTDLVRVLATWVAPANVENILVIGDGAIGATGNTGANVMTGNSGANALNGLGGNDSLAGGGGNDTLDGGEGADTLDGGAASDSLLGGNGNDSLLGGAGNDTISGGAGKDTIVGGAGKDTIVLNELPAAGQADSVVGFAAVDDTFQLLKTGLFTALATLGSLNGAAFWSGTAAHDPDDRIIYNPTSGVLLYDADGNGAGAAIQIATLTGLAGPLTQADFVVVA